MGEIEIKVNCLNGTNLFTIGLLTPCDAASSFETLWVKFAGALF